MHSSQSISSSPAVRHAPTSGAPASGDWPIRDEVPATTIPSFAEVYNTYFRFVWSIARYLGVEATSLDDVVQDIFVTICERLSTLQHPEALRSWIYGTTRRVVSTHHRSRRNALVTTGIIRVDSGLRGPDSPTPEHLAEQSERVKLLWSLVSKLDEQKRETFVLAELEEMTAPEIALVTNAPLNTVYSRLRSAREELEEALQRHIAKTRKTGHLSSI